MHRETIDAAIESKLDETVGCFLDRLVGECVELYRTARKVDRGIEEDAELIRLLRDTQRCLRPGTLEGFEPPPAGR